MKTFFFTLAALAAFAFPTTAQFTLTRGTSGTFVATAGGENKYLGRVEIAVYKPNEETASFKLVDAQERLDEAVANLDELNREHDIRHAEIKTEQHELIGYAAICLPLCFVAGFIARRKGRSAVGFFAIALFFSPLIGITAALFMKALTPTKKCPYCAEPIKKEANVCRYCGRDLPTTLMISTEAHEKPRKLAQQSPLPKSTSTLTVDQWKEKAVQQYPPLAVAGSPLDTAFAARFKAYQGTDYFDSPDWPMRLAKECVESVQSR